MRNKLDCNDTMSVLKNMAEVLDEYYLPRMVDYITTEGVLTKVVMRQAFIEAIEEYHSLTRWHWKRKRVLAKIIADMSIRYLKELKGKEVKVKYARNNSSIIKKTKK